MATSKTKRARKPAGKKSTARNKVMTKSAGKKTAGKTTAKKAGARKGASKGAKKAAPGKASASKAPATKAPATKKLASKASASKASASKAPASKASASKAPASKAPAAKKPARRGLAAAGKALMAAAVKAPAAAIKALAAVVKAPVAAVTGAVSSPSDAGEGDGTRERPWKLTTPSGQSEFTAYRDDAADPPALVVVVGKTELRYQLRCLDDLRQMLRTHGDWMLLGSADEQKPAAVGTVEAWARAGDNPVGGWYGLKKGLRGRFANYVPPVMKQLGLAEVESNPKNNRMRAV